MYHFSKRLGGSFLAFLMLIVANWAGSLNAQVLDPLVPTVNPNEYTLTISSVPPLGGTDVKKHYQVFWVFGDGTSLIERRFPPFANNKISIDHLYPSGTSSVNLKARAEITPIYTPGDDSKTRYVYPAGIGSLSDPPSTTSSRSLFGFVSGEFVRPPRKNSGTTLKIVYQGGANFCQLVDTGGLMKIHYNSSLELDLALDARWEHVQTFFNETVPDPTLTPGEITIQIPKGSAFTSFPREVFVNFFTDQKVQDPASVQITLLDSAGNYCLGDSAAGVTVESRKLKGENDPYDPNSKLVTPDTISEDFPQWLAYSIEIQNTGPAPTTVVKIEDQLDPRFDLDSIEVEYVSMGYREIVNPTDGETSTIPAGLPATQLPFTYRYIPPGNRIIWTLENMGDLRGTQEPGYGTMFGEKETWARIDYRVKTKRIPEKNTVIPNQAIVFFDNLPVVPTNVALTHKLCCQERLDQNDSLDIDLTAYIDTTSFPGPYSNFMPLALSTDELADTLRPTIFGSGPTIGYQAGPGFAGMDILTFSVENPDSTREFKVAICVGLSDTLYRCPDSTMVSNDPLLAPLPLRMFPNPFQNRLEVEALNPQRPLRQIEVLDSQGRLIWQQQLDRPLSKYQIQTDTWPSGLYLLRINEGETVIKAIRQE